MATQDDFRSHKRIRVDDRIPVAVTRADGKWERGFAIVSKELGRGGQGEVWLAQLRSPSNLGITSEHYVVLKIPLSEDAEDNLAKEGAVLKHVLGDSVVQLRGHVNSRGLDKGSAEDGLVLEFCNGGNLCDVCDEVTNAAFLRFAQKFLTMVQILDALVALNKKGYAHADLKPMNVLAKRPVDPNTGGMLPLNEALFDVVLADMGSVTKLRKRGRKAQGQTSLYACPKHVLSSYNWYTRPGRNANIDMWSLGLVMAGMFAGRALTDPFCASAKEGESMEDTMKRIHQDQAVPELVRNLLKDAGSKWVAVILRCMDYDVKTRPSPAQMLQEILTDPVFATERWQLHQENIQLPEVPHLEGVQRHNTKTADYSGYNLCRSPTIASYSPHGTTQADDKVTNVSLDGSFASDAAAKEAGMDKATRNYKGGSAVSDSWLSRLQITIEYKARQCRGIIALSSGLHHLKIRIVAQRESGLSLYVSEKKTLTVLRTVQAPNLSIYRKLIAQEQTEISNSKQFHFMVAERSLHVQARNRMST